MIQTLEKRIKRHVIGKPHEFFAITAPGFETLCTQELAALGLSGRTVFGGVEFNARLHDAYLANLHLRTASRILMRIHSFRANAFRSFEKAASQFPWELFMPAGTTFRVHVTTHHCRLHHTEAIAERLAGFIRERLKQTTEPAVAPAPAEPDQQVFVRGTDDRFIISIDSTGPNLYRRGIKTHSGKAPLRETMAAAALMHAGFSGGPPLLDPMCGAGTFSLEAALMAKKIPPGWFRRFAFMGWPSFRATRWNFLRRQSAEGIRELGRPIIFASDIDPEACQRLEECLQRCALADAVSVACRDFFELDPREVTDRPGLVALNPPYGRRIGSTSESRELTDAVIARLQSHYHGWRFILMAPAGRSRPDIGSRVREHPFIHGGLKVNVMTGRISPI
jgi:putative N6-adenine-specific DNA methylase